MQPQLAQSLSNPQAAGLRPAIKPIVLRMSRLFMKAATDVNLVKLTELLKRVFLRLGFNGYRIEKTPTGVRLRISGRNLNTGHYCDSHSLMLGRLEISEDIAAAINDNGGSYTLSLSLATEAAGGEAA